MQFACASALAMLVEGEPEMCPQVLRHGGVAALTIMLQTAGAQGRKAAAEALQVKSLAPMNLQASCASLICLEYAPLYSGCTAVLGRLSSSGADWFGCSGAGSIHAARQQVRRQCAKLSWSSFAGFGS